MREFQYDAEISGNTVHLKLQGYIDENATFPFSYEKPEHIQIDMQEVAGINSIGTRSWCEWVDNYKDCKSIKVYNCPPIVIKVFNNVFGAHAKNMSIESFYVPFVSPDNDEFKNVLAEKSKILKGNTIEFEDVLDSNGQPMELDVLDSYFDFLKE